MHRIHCFLRYRASNEPTSHPRIRVVTLHLFLCYVLFWQCCGSHTDSKKMDLNVKSIDDIILTQKVASKKGAKLKPSRNVAFLIDANISATAPLLEERLSHLYEGFTARNVVSEAEGKFVLWQSSTTSKAGATPNLGLVQKVITDCGGEDALGIKKWGGTTSDKASMQVSLNMITMLCLLHDVASMR